MPNGGNNPEPKPKAAQVDELADRIVKAFNNPSARRWYCGVIYKYGPGRVEDWLGRATSGEAHTPAALFTHYVNEAGGYRKVR